jgi:hypothetical protein
MITPGIFWIDNIIYAEPFLSTSFYLEELEGGVIFFFPFFPIISIYLLPKKSPHVESNHGKIEIHK